MAAVPSLPMYESLPPALRHWVADPAASMGLPGSDDFVVLHLWQEKQRQELEPVNRPAMDKQLA
jgi:hypothetical protein